MNIPQSQRLTTRHINRVFDKKLLHTNIIGILDLHVKQGKTRMDIFG